MEEKELVFFKEAQVLAYLLDIQCCLACGDSFRCKYTPLTEKWFAEAYTLEEYLRIGSFIKDVF